MAGSTRGRPRKNAPFFCDPDAESLRVQKCRVAGRDPYPKFKNTPCEAERSLREGIMPWVPFDLVLDLNETDDGGRPVASPDAERPWDEAKALREKAARDGGHMRQKRNLAKEIVKSEGQYISEKRSEEWSTSRIISEINKRRKKNGEKCAGRSEMYAQLRNTPKK